MDRLDDIQTALKLFKKWEKFEIHFMTILELAELFKTMNSSNQTGPTITLVTVYFSENMKERDVTFSHNLYLSL